MADSPSTSKIDDAVEFLRHAEQAESQNRQLGLTCLQFRYGDQWPSYAVASRGLDRPRVTINETNAMLKKVTNAQRRQRPRGKASPVDGNADPKVAKVITGLLRHIEVNSDADNAYDTAFDFAATIGWGYWRLRTGYVSDMSFDQDIFIDCIDNPFSVYFDWDSKLPDGSDAKGALITDLMAKEAFRQEYKGAQESNFDQRALGDSDPVWATETDIRIAEYFCIDRKAAKLLMLTNGELVWADEMPKLKQFMAQMGIGIKGDRDSMKSVVTWRKQTAFEILEEKPLPGRWIPVVPMYWTSVNIDGKVNRFGLVKDAMDPAQMNNFWQSAVTESLGQAIKPKYLIAEGQDEGHENEWKNANQATTATLRYKQTDVAGQPAPPPIRIAAEPPPAGFIEAAFMARQNLSQVMGVFDPAVRGGAQHKSDKTLNAERGQSENTNFDGYDNLTRSMKHTYRIALSWIPAVFDTKGRIQRIIGEDGREELVTLNDQQQQQSPDGVGAAIEKVLNDMCVGTYDVVMNTGPDFDTLRQEGTQSMIELMGTPLGEKVAGAADDLIVRNMDFPGADQIADRLAAANPLSQIDEKLDIPPAAQMKMKAQDAQIQQLTQQLQEAGIEIKFGLKKEEMKQQGATQRTHLQSITKAHDTNERNLSMQHSTETKALSAQNVEEIKGLVTLLDSHVGNNHQLRTMLMEFQQAVDIQDKQLAAKSAENASQPTAPVQ